MQHKKAEFSRESLKSLMDKANRDPTLLEPDWRKAVIDHFLLTPEQERGLRELSPEKVKHIQDHLSELARHVRGGGMIRGELVKRPPSEQTADFVYDVVVEIADDGRHPSSE